VGPDHARAVEAPLDERLLADENPVADLEGLGMAGDCAAADDHPVPEAAAERTPDRAPHPRSLGAVGERGLRGQLEQPLA
jgi:hypothetical protein